MCVCVCVCARARARVCVCVCKQSPDLYVGGGGEGSRRKGDGIMKGLDGFLENNFLFYQLMLFRLGGFDCIE